ncbi:MAG: LysR family transcriptional regulator [Saprospiraceae bacterium]|nr:LysR family transcriptional regulator [Saprospiraceae bacterium]
MELRQLKYFVAIAEEGQFVSASRKLLVSQPALSQQIKLLEEELGVDLFIKVKRQIYRKVELSEVGKVFLKDAQKILQLCEKAQIKVKNSNAIKQNIKLGTYRMLTGKRIVEVLAQFSQHFPEFDIQIVELPTFLSVQEALLDETIDFGISVLPIHYKNLDYISLKKSHLSVILPQNHPLVNHPKLTLSELHMERWIEIEASVHPIFESIEKLCIKAGFHRRQNIVQEVSSLEIMAQLVSMGKGIALVPSFFDTNTIPNIVNKPLDDAIIELEQCLTFRTNRFKDISNALKNVFMNYNTSVIF